MIGTTARNVAQMWSGIHCGQIGACDVGSCLGSGASIAGRSHGASVSRALSLLQIPERSHDDPSAQGIRPTS